MLSNFEIHVILEWTICKFLLFVDRHSRPQGTKKPSPSILYSWSVDEGYSIVMCTFVNRIALRHVWAVSRLACKQQRFFQRFMPNVAIITAYSSHCAVYFEKCGELSVRCTTFFQHILKKFCRKLLDRKHGITDENITVQTYNLPLQPFSSS